MADDILSHSVGDNQALITAVPRPVTMAKLRRIWSKHPPPRKAGSRASSSDTSADDRGMLVTSEERKGMKGDNYLLETSRTGHPNQASSMSSPKRSGLTPAPFHDGEVISSGETSSSSNSGSKRRSVHFAAATPSRGYVNDSPEPSPLDAQIASAHRSSGNSHRGRSPMARSSPQLNKHGVYYSFEPPSRSPAVLTPLSDFSSYLVSPTVNSRSSPSTTPSPALANIPTARHESKISKLVKDSVQESPDYSESKRAGDRIRKRQWVSCKRIACFSPEPKLEDYLRESSKHVKESADKHSYLFDSPGLSQSTPTTPSPGYGDGGAGSGFLADMVWKPAVVGERRVFENQKLSSIPATWNRAFDPRDDERGHVLSPFRNQQQSSLSSAAPATLRQAFQKTAAARLKVFDATSSPAARGDHVENVPITASPQLEQKVSQPFDEDEQPPPSSLVHATFAFPARVLAYFLSPVVSLGSNLASEIKIRTLETWRGRRLICLYGGFGVVLGTSVDGPLSVPTSAFDSGWPSSRTASGSEISLTSSYEDSLDESVIDKYDIRRESSSCCDGSSADDS